MGIRAWWRTRYAWRDTPGRRFWQAGQDLRARRATYVQGVRRR